MNIKFKKRKISFFFKLYEVVIMSNIFFLISVAIALVTFNGFKLVVYTFKDFTLKFEIGYLGRIFITSLIDEKLSTISDTFFPII